MRLHGALSVLEARRRAEMMYALLLRLARRYVQRAASILASGGPALTALHLASGALALVRVARRAPEKPGRAPYDLSALKAAAEALFKEAAGVHAVRTVHKWSARYGERARQNPSAVESLIWADSLRQARSALREGEALARR